MPLHSLIHSVNLLLLPSHSPNPNSCLPRVTRMHGAEQAATQKEMMGSRKKQKLLTKWTEMVPNAQPCYRQLRLLISA